MAFRPAMPSSGFALLLALTVLVFSTPTAAFGAGYVSRGSALKATNFRHGDIALAIPLLATANRRITKQIYFGNWLRDFSQLLDKSSLSLIPRPLLRALVAVFAFVQFGYATREFEVTDERLGFYRPEEHVDNPRGYDSAISAATSTGQEPAKERVAGYRISEGLRPAVHPTELQVDPRSGMKNYIANTDEAGVFNPTSADYVEKQLVAAITCGRQGDQQAYMHLGAALHTLEDFVAHSNYIELAMQLISTEMKEHANVTPALGKVFAFVGGATKIRTATSPAYPITTGTFGALDLYQTLLGEIDDKLAAMSLPGIRARMSEKNGALSGLTKGLIALLGGLSPSFEKNIVSIQKAAANPEPATWGELDESPEKLWESLKPVFTLRDDIVKWVYDHLTVRAVQDALAAISTAIDKLVYMVLGIFLGPLLTDFSRILKERKEDLFERDQEARLATGDDSVFSGDSFATDPTHSQLAKDHYDNELNEIAGRVAIRISSYTVTEIVQLWSPGNMTDPKPTLDRILHAFHHPFNKNPEFPIQAMMFSEVQSYVTNQLVSNTAAFEQNLQSLTSNAVASRVHEHATASANQSHVETLTAVHAPNSVAPQTAHDLVTTQRPEVQHGFAQKISDNIEKQLKNGNIGKVGIKDFEEIKQLLFAPPGAETPNPLDSGIAKVPGISYLGTFNDVDINEIAAADGMGETLKDAVISLILLDETRGVKEEEIAAHRFGWGKTEAERAERRRLKELREMLKIEKLHVKLQEGQFLDETKGMREKVKEGFAKLKLKAGRD